jgi:hypothetical protein|tara:strand:+ start:769 stop:1410 length:642 start_codon:yes stop_codon:yes gene_type:complete
VILIVIISGLILFSYPDPYAPLRPQEEYSLFARTVLVTDADGLGNNITYLVGGVEIKIDLVTSSGLRHALSVETNSSGVAVINMTSGYYRISVSDWWSGYMLFNKQTKLNITKHDFTQQPSSLDIFSLSRNWTISKGDILEASYENKAGIPITIDSVIIANEQTFRPHQEVEPASEWQGTYTVPRNVSVPWSAANKSRVVTLKISYTEVSIYD